MQIDHTLGIEFIIRGQNVTFKYKVPLDFLRGTTTQRKPALD